ncbi:MAG: VOC family protein [Reichenbachiella sp.]
MKRVTGIGGIFFKSKDPIKSREWYNKHLGLSTNEYGSLFEFRQGAKPEEKGYLQWSPMSKDTKYYEPSKSEFMINYRVDNLILLLKQLKEEGVKIVGEMEEFEYGKFAWIMDDEGHKIELWEPVDEVFTKDYEGKTTI